MLEAKELKLLTPWGEDNTHQTEEEKKNIGFFQTSSRELELELQQRKKCFLQSALMRPILLKLNFSK